MTSPIPRRLALAALAALALAAVPSVDAFAATPLKIGEINSYKAQPAFLEPYRKGMELAVEQVNAGGGVGGRKLELVTRDDNANPGDAVRMAEELIAREKVDVLAGGFLSNVGLALADFAQQNKRFYLASEPLTDKLVWTHGNRYTFRLRASTAMQVSMLAPEAARLGKKRWAIVYPNYEYGQSAAQSFKAALKALQPDVEFVAEQAPPLGKIDAGAVAQALGDARPDAIFNVLFAADLSRFVREGNTRGLFKDRAVVSLLTGEPEYLEPLRDEAPNGWIVTGYPYASIDTAAHKAFRQAYLKKWKEEPRLGSVVGYSAIKAIAAGAAAAKSTDTEAMIAAFRGLSFDSPFGPVSFRRQDHQSTMGAFVGLTKNQGGKGVMVEHRYVDGASVQPRDELVTRLRPPGSE